LARKKAKTSLHLTKPEEKESASFIMRLGLVLRNLFVVISTVLFLISVLNQHQNHLLKVIAYFNGMLAYFCEYLHLTKFFRQKIPHDELFMIYCFAPIYFLMGLSYLMS